MKKAMVNIITLLEKGTVYIPNAVDSYEGICEETKLMFGIIFSECVGKISNIKEWAAEADKAICRFILDIDLSLIASECMCSMETAKKVKQELTALSITLNIKSCILDCETVIVKPDYQRCSNIKTFLSFLPPDEQKRAVSQIMDMLEKKYPQTTKTIT